MQSRGIPTVWDTDVPGGPSGANEDAARGDQKLPTGHPPPLIIHCIAVDPFTKEKEENAPSLVLVMPPTLLYIRAGVGRHLSPAGF
jgi:hypothetical protein